MPRSRQSKDPRTEIASKVWSIHEDYVSRMIAKPLLATMRHKSEISCLSKDLAFQPVDVHSIVKVGEPNTSYSLSDPTTYEELLSEYLDIIDAPSALDYVRRRGLPGTQNDIAISIMLDSAAYMRWLIALSEAVSDQNFRKLDSYVTSKTSRQGQVIVTVGNPSGESINAFHTSCADGIIVPMRWTEAPYSFTTAAWESFGRKAKLYAVQNYLKAAIDHLLTGVQPTLDWRFTVDGNWILDETIAVDTPWQAICYALLLNISGKGRLRPCKHCGKRFRAKRKDKEFCQDACTRAHNRQYGQTVHSYTQKSKRGNNQ